MDNVVKFPDAPEWASAVDAKMLDRLVAKGYLRQDQRRNWCAVEAAINSAFFACVFDPRPELSPQKVLEHMLRPRQPLEPCDAPVGCTARFASEQRKQTLTQSPAVNRRDGGHN